LIVSRLFSSIIFSTNSSIGHEIMTRSNFGSSVWGKSEPYIMCGLFSLWKDDDVRSHLMDHSFSKCFSRGSKKSWFFSNFFVLRSYK